jgi:PilZ domain
MATYENERVVPRYRVDADIELTDAESGVQLRGRTSNLCLFGCGVKTLSNFPPGTNVSVKMIYEGTELFALAIVVYSMQDLGVGIAFTDIASKDERILCGWIAGLASREPL